MKAYKVVIIGAVLVCLFLIGSFKCLAQRYDTLNQRAFILVADTAHQIETKWVKIPCPKDSIVRGKDSCLEKQTEDKGPVYAGQVFWVYGIIRYVRPKGDKDYKRTRIEYLLSDGRKIDPKIKVIYATQ